MTQLIKIFILSILFISCNNTNRDKIDASKSILLFKEGGDLFMKGVALELNDSLEAQEYFKKSIDKFQKAYKYDTTNIQLGIYLSDVYFKTQKYDSALLWAIRLLEYDTTAADEKQLMTISDKHIFIGRCYLYQGDLVNAEKHFKQGLNLNSLQYNSLQRIIFTIADEYFYGIVPGKSEILKNKKINYCRYSLDILRMYHSIISGEQNSNDLDLIRNKIIERKKECR